MGQIGPVLSPVGRLVGGSLVEPSDEDIKGNPLKDRKGNERVEYVIQVAFAKNDPDWPAYHMAIWAELRAGFPHLFGPTGQPLPGVNLHTKVTDGDSQVPNSKGTKPCDKEGWPGNYIVTFKSGFAPRCYKEGNAKGTWDQIEATMIKRGYFIRVSGNISGNNNAQNPGVFMNIGQVEFLAYGQEIQSGISPSEAFAKPVVNLPPGASMIPLAPATSAPMAPPPAAPGVAPAAPGMYPPPAMPPAAPAMPGAYPPPAAPAVPAVTPDYTFAQGAAAPPPMAPPPAAPAAPPAAEVKYMYQGKAWTEGQLLAASWDKRTIAALPRA